MRHTRTRHQFKILLAALSALSILLFFESRIESFAPQLRSIIESKIESVFNRDIRLSIGKLDGGIIRPVTLKDVKVYDREGRELFPSLEIKSIRSNYRIWDALFKSSLQHVFPRLFAQEPYMLINWMTKNREIISAVRCEGDFGNVRINGFIKLFGDEKIDVSGKIRNDKAELVLKPRTGIVKAEGTIMPDSSLAISLMINHLKLRSFDITCVATIKNRFIRDTDNASGGHIEGEIETKNFILNYRPFLDLKGSYILNKNSLVIPNAEIGKGCTIHGNITVKKPYTVVIVATADNVNLAPILATFNPSYPDCISGTMNARCELKGPLDKPGLDMKLEIRKGTLTQMDFDCLSAHFKGEGPVIKIEDSRITRQSGYFALSGEMDLRKIGKDTFFDNIKMITDDKAIVWDKWDTTKMQDIQEVRMKKKMGEEISLGFKKFLLNGRVDESLRDKDEVELEYSLHSKESLKIRFGENKDSFFGLEHKDRF